MRVLWSWLLEFCDFDRQPTVDEGARALTRGGLEIEAQIDLGARFRGVVVAEVVAKRPHPQVDKLTLVDVIVERGGAATQVVCGAPNVPEPGRKVLWAQVGATLPNNITLTPKAVKGVISPGMLCAEDERGLSEEHAGIVVLDEGDPTAIGAPAQRALGLEDHVLEINAPANRGDVLGHLGVARELVAMLRGKLVLPDIDLTAFVAGGKTEMERAIADAAQCPRYVARTIHGVRVAPSPKRIAQRLRAVGVRPISNLVDVTNYVLFELGQPLHAFDAATLRTRVIGVSGARDGEKLTTLDGVERGLVPSDLVIRDGERGIALAGVMGGADTEVTAGTTDVLLESASFKALSVRKTARRLGLHSEASHRFERGVDPELAGLASARAARLICSIAGGHVVIDPVDAYPGKRSPAAIPVRMSRVHLLTGVHLDEAACRDALERLGFTVAHPSAAQLEVTPPSARADVTREVDVIEEILRVTGYEQVPSTLPALRRAPAGAGDDRADAARLALAGAGSAEAITYGFQSSDRCAALGLAATDRRAQPIAVRNPMSAEQAVMRTSLLPNLIAAIARNQSYGRPDVNLFEVGSVFLRRGESAAERPLTELADEPTWAAGVLAGRRPGHVGHGAPYDAFDAQALAVAAIRAVAGAIDVHARAATGVSYLHPGVAGELVVAGTIVGRFGELHPDVRARLGVTGAAFAYEVDLGLLPAAPPAQMKPIPKFPGSERDVSLLLADTIPAGRVADVIAAANQPLVAGVRPLEDYRDPKLGAGMKSMLWSIAYRALDRTLTDAEVDAAHEAIVGRLVDNSRRSAGDTLAPVSYPFGSWVMIDRLPDEPVVAFVYLDPHAGPSAKGGLASQHDLAVMPSRTVRLSPQVALRELTEAEIIARKLPPKPQWLATYGPQPDPQAPWHRDPLLTGKFNPQYPDDIQTLVHDGDPRRTRRGPELCWVRILRVDRAPTRQVAADYEPSRHIYIGELLNQPHTLESVKKGDRIKLISVHGLAHPLHVTDEYLREREVWRITPCDRCGASECYDPPSVMAQVRFPEATKDHAPIAFTSFCSHCGGVQQLTRV